MTPDLNGEKSLKSSRFGKSKDIVYVLLKESLRGENCPLCYLLVKQKERWLDSLLYEHVNDSVIREKIRRLGFCTKHLWDILEYSERNPVVDGLGISIILQDMLETELAYLLKTSQVQEKRVSECILCKSLDESEKSYLESFAIWLREKEFSELYKTSSSIFCLNHYKFVFKGLDEVSRVVLLQIQLTKLEKLNKNLESFIRKFDWNVKEKPTCEEAEAKGKTVNVLKGGNY